MALQVKVTDVLGWTTLVDVLKEQDLLRAERGSKHIYGFLSGQDSQFLMHAEKFHHLLVEQRFYRERPLFVLPSPVRAVRLCAAGCHTMYVETFYSSTRAPKWWCKG